MSTTKAEKLIKTYRNLAQIPALVGARLTKSNVITSVWTQRNLEKGKTTKFSKTHIISPEHTFTELMPVDISNEIISRDSPTGSFRAVLREVEGSSGLQFLEVWKNNNLYRSIDLASLEIHGKVYTDATFGCLEWSPDEKQLLYVAEKKIPKKDALNKRKPKKLDDEKTADLKGGDEYRQEWGEQMVGKISSVIVTYDIEKDDFVFPQGVPEGYCVAELVWQPSGKSIVGVAYRTEPRKLGIIYCTNRESAIFSLDFEGNYLEVPISNVSVKAPTFTPDGKSLVWLNRTSGGPHHGCMNLMQTSTHNFASKPSELVAVVLKEREIVGKRKFYGLYNTGFVNRCWSSDGRIIVTTNQRNSMNTYVISLDTDLITELEYPNGSLILLDVKDDIILANRRNFFQQDTLVMGKLPAKGHENEIKWIEVTQPIVLEGANDKIFNYIDLSHDNKDLINTFSAIYVGPKSGSESEVPLIVWPHGGPHSAFSNNLSLECSLFLTLGYAILMVNYRGSVGAGEQTVEFLPSRVGSADVEDCVLATKKALEKYPWLNKSQVALSGGSHGGFLVTHLSGQYPDMYKAVVARNPVIDVASMSITSDIPDWCYVEAGYPYTQQGEMNDDLLLSMRKVSPIKHAHKVKAPTLLQIGSNDLRVPPSQGVEYYHRLKANNAIVKMNMYDDNHPLGSVPNEMDYLISTALWFEEHVLKI